MANLIFQYSIEDFFLIESGQEVVRPTMEAPEFPSGSWGAFLCDYAEMVSKKTFLRFLNEGFAIDHSILETGGYNRAFGYVFCVTPDMFTQPEDQAITRKRPTGGAGYNIIFRAIHAKAVPYDPDIYEL